jgi:hypothetical protein
MISIIINTTHGIRRDSGNIRRDLGNIRLDSGNIRRDSGNIRRDSGNIRRESGNIRHDSGSIREHMIHVSCTAPATSTMVSSCHEMYHTVISKLFGLPSKTQTQDWLRVRHRGFLCSHHVPLHGVRVSHEVPECSLKWPECSPK